MLHCTRQANVTLSTFLDYIGIQKILQKVIDRLIFLISKQFPNEISIKISANDFFTQ